jgi:hypothetical protein
MPSVDSMDQTCGVLPTSQSRRASLWSYYQRRATHYAGGVEGAHAYFAGLGVDVDLEALRAELEEVEERLGGLDPVPFLDVGAGPGVFTGIVPGTGFALDQSDAALERLRTVLAAVPVVCGDAAALPVRAKSVIRLFAGHLYGHLEPTEREAFLTEARRVADELVILDSGRPLGAQAEEWQSRRMDDGSMYTVYKRHLTVEELAREIGGEALFGGRYYVLARCVA